MLKQPVTLPIKWWDNDQTSLHQIGIRPNFEETKTKTVTFYSIDNISPYEEGDSVGCAVTSGGIEYICSWDYIKVKLTIDLSQ